MPHRFADVLLPLPIPGAFTYSIPAEVTTPPPVGSRVLVPFGSKKIYTAVVVLTHDREPQGYAVKPLLAVLDTRPIVRHPQLKFWQWIADYYLCTPGEVYKAALPAGLKMESETVVAVNADYEEPHSGALSERERTLLDFAAHNSRTRIVDLEKATGYKNTLSLVSHLAECGALRVSERVVDNYRPRTQSCVRLTAARGDEAALHAMFDRVSRARRQEALLLAYLDMSRFMQRNVAVAEVTKEALLERAQATPAVLSAAVKAGIFEVYKREVNRFDSNGHIAGPPPSLTAEQDRAYREIHNSMAQHDITLLHGVTSSGKTSVYIHLLLDALRKGGQALLLVPEIALTTQLTGRLRRVLGDKLLVYHSKFSDNERVDIYRRLLTGHDPCVVIGVRSSVFLPFANLSLVIVDEEHDSSYKQQDPAPRYNGRNAAIMLARMHGAKVLLGSATPAIEVYHRALNGKYGLVRLLSRYGNIQLPRVEVVDTRDARKRKQMSGIFSDTLLRYCRHALDKGEQVILFQNRRGYAPMVRCKECGWVPKCDNCDVSLTYHKHTRSLVCHYCGFTASLPVLCPACQMPGIEIVGYGTERIEDNVDAAFPGQKIARMDLDTTRSKAAYDRIIDQFSARKTNVLIGTQMVTKGLDFDGVSVVGILNADTMISFPDFRAHERAFDMMEQVAGRAGRANSQGLVVLQTGEPAHPVIDFVKAHDYEGFYQHELNERRQFGYPPFVRIINVVIRHRDEQAVDQLANAYADALRQSLGRRVLGPMKPYVARVQQLYIRQLTIKVEVEASMTKVKQVLRAVYEQMLHADARMKNARLHYDVDPV